MTIPVYTTRGQGHIENEDPKFRANYAERTCLGRLAGPHYLEGIVVFLAGAAASNITGANIPVDGGTPPSVSGWAAALIGTARLGGSYGIGNRSGTPSQEATLAMVEATLEGGIDTFDTASRSGGVRGRAGPGAPTLGVAEDVHVVTRVPADGARGAGG